MCNVFKKKFLITHFSGMGKKKTPVIRLRDLRTPDRTGRQKISIDKV